MDQQQTDENPACGQSRSTELLSAQADPESWAVCNIAAVCEGEKRVIRVATNGTRVRIRCTDMRFDPPIEMDLKDFESIMAAASVIGLKAQGDVAMERKELTLNDDIKGRA